MNIEELQQLINEYLLTLDNVKKDEIYNTDRMIAAGELGGFVEWLQLRVYGDQ